MKSALNCDKATEEWLTNVNLEDLVFHSPSPIYPLEAG